jgi:hypothetical protein
VFAQIIIASTEVTAMLLLSSKKQSIRKYAAIFGLIGQPFWFYSSYQAGQFGAFFLCFVFSAIWLKNLYSDYFMTTKKDNPLKQISNKDAYTLIMVALNKIKTGEQPNIDHYDYIERVLKETLLEE